MLPNIILSDADMYNNDIVLSVFSREHFLKDSFIQPVYNVIVY